MWECHREQIAICDTLYSIVCISQKLPYQVSIDKCYWFYFFLDLAAAFTRLSSGGITRDESHFLRYLNYILGSCDIWDTWHTNVAIALHHRSLSHHCRTCFSHFWPCSSLIWPILFTTFQWKALLDHVSTIFIWSTALQAAPLIGVLSCLMAIKQ